MKKINFLRNSMALVAVSLMGAFTPAFAQEEELSPTEKNTQSIAALESKVNALSNLKVMTVEELPKEFIGVGDVRGFKFTQISNGSNAYIYEVECEEPWTKDKSTHYEVIKKVAVNKCLAIANRI